MYLIKPVLLVSGHFWSLKSVLIRCPDYGGCPKYFLSYIGT